MDDLPILDGARLSLITRGDGALASEFVSLFFQECAGLFERLERLLEGDDPAAVRDAAHTLKGMAMELGAMRFRAAALALEQETHRERLPECVARLRTALAELRAYDRTKPV